jgi:Raf kinase inhibitor-like YbhB/YbcL family protein
MKKRKIQRYFIFTVGIILLVSIIGLQSFTKQKNKESENSGGNTMELYSSAFQNEEFIPKKYCCKGEDINPELQWDNVPEGTKSFALSVKDPDAPIGTFVHWLVYDIDKNMRKIEENSVPGKQVENNFGKDGYGGPCPPSGVHRYYFRLHALDVETLGSIETMKEFDQKVEEHTIEKAELMGKFKK